MIDGAVRHRDLALQLERRFTRIGGQPGSLMPGGLCRGTSGVCCVARCFRGKDAAVRLRRVQACRRLLRSLTAREEHSSRSGPRCLLQETSRVEEYAFIIRV